jgi:nicotinamidase/pyrazinamidase
VNHLGKEKRRGALLVVDVQRDFCPRGALPVKEGDRVVEPLNRIIATFTKNQLPIFFTRDWHPKNHCSFKERGGPWPQHCVQNTFGAEFQPPLLVPKEAVIISKGTEPDREAYSGFEGTNLATILNGIGVSRLFIGGLATDYCVKNTVLDALKNDYEVTLLKDCVKGVNAKPNDSLRAVRDMKAAGAIISTSHEVIIDVGRRRKSPQRRQADA